jgi:hypothetical protein
VWVEFCIESFSHQGPKLRSLASNYCTEFLQCIASLLSGTAEGNAVISGETLEEEKRGHGDASWRANNNLPIVFKGGKKRKDCFGFVVLTVFVLKGEVEVPLAGTKLYGGQQLERLLAEFLAVCSRSEIAEPSLADVANAAGLNKVRFGSCCCAFCFVLFCFVLFCFVLFCFVLFCFVLFCFVLFCFVLFCFVLFCFVLFLFLFLFCFCLVSTQNLCLKAIQLTWHGPLPTWPSTSQR